MHPNKCQNTLLLPITVTSLQRQELITNEWRAPDNLCLSSKVAFVEVPLYSLDIKSLKATYLTTGLKFYWQLLTNRQNFNQQMTFAHPNPGGGSITAAFSCLVYVPALAGGVI